MSLLNDPPAEPVADPANPVIKHTQPEYPKVDADGNPVVEEPVVDPVIEDPVVEEPVVEDGKLTENEWKAKLREGVPETPDGYELPTIEGFDAEAAKDSPIMKVLRDTAHEAGLKPEAFNKAVEEYVKAEVEETNKFHTEQMSMLGKDEAAQKQRVGQVNAALTRMLPEDLAKGLMEVAATATAVRAIEALVNRSPNAAPSSPPPPADDWATINKLMNSREYMGYEHERDPKVVQRVDAYFEKGGKRE